MDAMMPVPAGSGSLPAAGFCSAELLERFIKYLDVAPKTVSTYSKALRQMFRFLAERGASRPDRDDIVAYRESLKASGCTPSTVSLYMAAARVFFRWAAQESLYPDIAERVKGAKIDREHKKDYLTAAQIKRVMNGVDRSSLQGARDYAMLALMAACGLRTIEVSRADIQDLGTSGGSTVLYVQGKGHEEKSAYVKVPEAVENAIRGYLAARGNVEETEPLFASLSHNSAGRRMTTRSISGMVKARMQSAGFNSKRLTAHSLRHTAVTLSLLAGKSLEEVRQFARHASVNTTLIYSHAVEAEKNTCSAAVADAIFQQKEESA